jgi:hypothetical protein
MLREHATGMQIVELVEERVVRVDEGLIRPRVVPVAVASTIENSYFVQIGMHRSDGSRTICVKYDVGISIDASLFEHDGIVVTYEAATAEIFDNRFD